MFSTILSNVPPESLYLLLILLISAGIFTGIIAGLFGVGGGVVVVPTLYYIFTLAEVDENIRMHLAVGTSLANIIPISIVSALSHAKITIFQLLFHGKTSPKKNSNLFGMETPIMKKETISGMELMVFLNGLQKKHIKCMSGFFYRNTGVISNALLAKVIA